MPYTHHLYLRTSFRYIDAYKNEDTSRYLGKAKLLPARLVREADDYDDGGTYLQRAIFKGGKPSEVMAALRNTLGGSNCTHEWDCCGCASRRVSVRHVSRNEYVVKTDVSYNY